MASYIPGITDYIPQFQPFQPDYNFLGNILQNSQSKYDSNYKQLNQTYGSLLNAPMSREDNIQQRDEFFKMIDGDIKKISGMDLSLQQNVDSANAVYESIYKNKYIVNDMNYTRQYQNQLETGQNYRNCIDQEKCGGLYSDEAMNALHYKQDEYKKATRQDSLTMSPGRFTPFINIQEKAVKFAKDMLGKNGAFGITSVGLDKSGRYIVTTTNGAQLQVPLEQLLLNEYSQDPTIQDMYNTKAYVNRKSFIQQNAEKFGSEDAAEDEYFRQADVEAQKAKDEYQKAVDLRNGTQAKKDILTEKIKTNGSTGDDDLADDYIAAGADAAAAKQSADYHEESHKVANSIFDAGDNRQMKRQRIDGLYSRSLMTKSIYDSADAVVAMTGTQTMIADPYAKSYYDFSLDMSKMQKEYELKDRNELNKNIYELSKAQALEEAKKRGSAVAPENTPVWMPNTPGTASNDFDENAELTKDIATQVAGAQGAATGFVNSYVNMLMSTATAEHATPAEKTNAVATLTRIYGVAQVGPDGKVFKAGYDIKSNTFLDKNGVKHNNPADVSDDLDWRTTYAKAQAEVKANRSIPGTKEFIEGDGQKFIDRYNTSTKLLNVSSNLWRENNKNIHNFAVNDRVASAELKDPDKKLAWDTRFTKEGHMKLIEPFTKDYANAYAEAHAGEIGRHAKGSVKTGILYYNVTKEDLLKKGAELASNKFAETDKLYHTLYSSGDSIGKGVPLIKPLHPTSMLDRFGGGKVSGGVSMDYNADSPASFGTRGLLTFVKDAQAADMGATYAFGNHVEAGDIKMDQEAETHAKTAVETLAADLKAGRLTKEEAALAGKVLYMDTALSDDKKTGITVNFPPTWLKKYQAKKDEADTWANDENLSQGVSIYLNKSDARTNDFTSSFNYKPYDVILDQQDETISLPNAGKITIQKRDAAGNLNVQGTITAYDAAGNAQSIDVSHTYSNDTGGQNAYNALNQWMQEINKVNTAYKNHQNVDTRIYDPQNLPKVKQMLDQAAGDAPTQPDMTAIFGSMLRSNMQSMQTQ